MDDLLVFERLRGRISGAVYVREDEGYEDVRCGVAWNGRKPNKYPLALILAQCQEDVMVVVSFARENRLSISCKTGGHSHSVCFLQEDCILLDLSKLNEIRVDAERRVVYAQPGVTSRQLNSALNDYSLAFPTGHDGEVTMAGFLLGGGLGINCSAWGG
ncbi:FAD-binding oxidoreductase [Pseudomonas chlororaphis]|uniref:FAD-binding oxidoreductase n=1 Tax=Pseudomonas chlororaphis TaxID=587753 RepID=UPI0013DE5015|nr:FAD-binding protein [Pseudomonas chlororaphis]